MIKWLTTGFVVLATAMPALAAPPSKAEVLQKAAEGAAACGQAMPDPRRIGAALNAAGYKLDEGGGTYKAYTALGKRVVVIISGNRPGNDGCAVIASGMTVSEAEALIQPWVAMSDARPGPIGDSPRGSFEKGWIGVLRGRPFDFGINKEIRFPIIRGAAIVARSLD